MKIFIRGEVLSDQPRPDHLAVTGDQFTIGLASQRKLRESGNHPRIKDAQQHRSDQRVANCNLQRISKHVDSLCEVECSQHNVDHRNANEWDDDAAHPVNQ